MDTIDPFDPHALAHQYIAIAADPKAAKARLREVERAEAAQAKRGAELDAREAAVVDGEAKLAVDRNEVAQQFTTLRQQKVAFHAEQRQAKEREQRLVQQVAELEAQLGLHVPAAGDFQAIEGSSITAHDRPPRRPLRTFPGVSLTAEPEPPEAA
jgi:hypothetical protein